MKTRITSKFWGHTNGQEVWLIRVENDRGAYVELSNYGATVVSICVPDNDGNAGNVVLGFKDLRGYLEDNCYIGSTIGPVANRIANAKFSLDDREYKLGANDGKHSNHSGSAGFNNKVFIYEIKDNSICFSYLKKDMDGGYPGNLNFEVRYEWTAENELKITYLAAADQRTVVNFTNHCYFNLSGESGNISDHKLSINASSIVEADEEYIPTGVILPADQFLFFKTRVGDKLRYSDNQVAGLNSCYILDKEEDEMTKAAVLEDPNSGRILTVYTTQPALMLYTGDYLNSKHAGHSGRTYQPFDGLCLECQYYPDSPNHLHFPSTVLEAGLNYQETIIYQFSSAL